MTFNTRPDYYRHISNISFGYNWNQTDKIKHVLNPAEITLVKIQPDSTLPLSLITLAIKGLKTNILIILLPG